MKRNLIVGRLLVGGLLLGALGILLQGMASQDSDPGMTISIGKE